MLEQLQPFFAQHLVIGNLAGDVWNETAARAVRAARLASRPLGRRRAGGRGGSLVHSCTPCAGHIRSMLAVAPRLLQFAASACASAASLARSVSYAPGKAPHDLRLITDSAEPAILLTSSTGWPVALTQLHDRAQRRSTLGATQTPEASPARCVLRDVLKVYDSPIEANPGGVAGIDRLTRDSAGRIEPDTPAAVARELSAAPRMIMPPVSTFSGIHVPHELRHILVAPAQHDVLGRAGLHDPAALQDRDAIAEPQRLVQVVADEQDGLLDPLLQRQQFILQLAADQRIERRERLVHQQNVRVGGKGARQPDALLHAAGQFADIAVRPLRKARPAPVSHRRCGARCAAGSPRSSRPKPTFSRTRAPRQQSELLEHHGDALAPHAAQLRARRRWRRRWPLAVAIQHAPAGHRVQAVGGAQQRGLAGARQAHQHGDLAARDA